MDRQLIQIADLDKQLAREKCRRFYYEFVKYFWPNIEAAEYVDNWHIGLLCEEAEAILAGEHKRVLINMPPRHMKSILFSVLLTAFDWIDNPWRQYLYFSYKQDLSFRDSEKCRRVIQSPQYQELYGDRFRLVIEQVAKITNDKHGQRLASTIGATSGGLGTGEGGDIIIIDDPHNVHKIESTQIRSNAIHFVQDVLPTRYNDPKTGVLICICHRVHPDDVSNYYIEQGGFRHVCLSAKYNPKHTYSFSGDIRTEPGEPLWKNRYGEKELADLEASLRAFTAAAQLDQDPKSYGGGYFKRSYFKKIAPEELPNDRTILRFWDLAATEKDEAKGRDPDWTAGVKCSIDEDKNFYIEHVVRGQWAPPNTDAKIRQTTKDDGRDVFVRMEQEGGASGKTVIYDFVTKLAGYDFRGVPSYGSKLEYARPFASYAKNGRVYVVEGSWNEAFLDEAESFPFFKKDQIDAASKGFDQLIQGKLQTAQVVKLTGL